MASFVEEEVVVGDLGARNVMAVGGPESRVVMVVVVVVVVVDAILRRRGVTDDA